MLGSGNTATVLSVLIKKAGHELVQVVSRNIENARSLAAVYGAASGSLKDPQFLEADLYILALNDSALESLDKITGIKNKFIVHTAGSVSINVIKDSSDRYGVLYPLQTLSKFTEHVPEIPFLVDGNNKET